jgi:hypothetical protein
MEDRHLSHIFVIMTGGDINRPGAGTHGGNRQSRRENVRATRVSVVGSYFVLDSATDCPQA